MDDLDAEKAAKAFKGFYIFIFLVVSFKIIIFVLRNI